MKAECVELPAFERYRAEYLDEEAFRTLQALLMKNPVVGARMPGAGGLRKLRFSDARRGKGKRGGLRIIHDWWPAGLQFWFFTLFDKDEMADLTPAQRVALRSLLQAELQARSGP